MQGALIEKHEKSFKLLINVDFKDLGFSSEPDDLVLELEDKVSLSNERIILLENSVKELAKSRNAPATLVGVSPDAADGEAESGSEEAQKDA